MDIRAYPTLITTANVMMLAGMPLVRKCWTRKYRCPVCESSIMIAARIIVSIVMSEETGNTRSYLETRMSAIPWRH
jgi:NAD dependent epimerase/dehydratase family enzyme